MALLNSNNNYIRLVPIANNVVECILYKEEQNRIDEKSSTPPELIINKYRELLNEARDKTYAQLKEAGLDHVFTKGVKSAPPEDIAKALEINKKFSDLHIEYHNYINDVQDQAGSQHEFPIIAKYFPDVEKSIPRVMSIIKIPMSANADVDTIYTRLKEEKRFGETTDC